MFGEDTLFPRECEGKRFIRRRDLTPEKRLQIAYILFSARETSDFSPHPEL